MRILPLLALLPLAACSGGDAAPPPSSTAPPTTVAPAPAPAPAETIASEHPFGCTLAVVDEGRVLWPTDDHAIAALADAGDAAPSWIPLPEAQASLAPAASHATVITATSVCTATLGAPEVRTVYEGDTPDLGRAISGCDATEVAFALLCPDGVAVPSNLRFAPFARGEVSVIDASTTEPLIVHAYRGREFYGDRAPCEADVAGHTEVVRARWASITVGTEHLAFTELARAYFPAGTDVETGCPDVETLHAAVWDMAGDPEHVAVGHDFAGALHDGTHVLALVEVGADSGAASCEGGNTCVYAALSTRTRFQPGQFVRRSHVVARLGAGELSYEPEVMLTNHREGCESD